MTPLSEAQQRLPLPTLMAVLGLEGHAKKNAKCPFHDDGKNSFSVHQNPAGRWRWKCFAGCGSGDEVAFLAQLHGTSNRDACREVIRMAGTAAIASFTPLPRSAKATTRQPLPPMPASVADAWREGVHHFQANESSILQLAQLRSWTDNFTRHLVNRGVVSLPLYHGRRGFAFEVVVPEGPRRGMLTRPVGYHARLYDLHGDVTWRFVPNTKEHGQTTPSLPFLIGNIERAELLIIAEGQWDALTVGLAMDWLGEGCIWPSNVCVIGIRGASGTTTFLEYYSPYISCTSKCLLLPDADRAGAPWWTGDRSFAEQLHRSCSDVVVSRCSRHKDFNDLYRSDPGTAGMHLRDLLRAKKMLSAEEPF